MHFCTVKRSLEDLLGADYIEAVCRSRAWLTGTSAASLLERGREAVDFWPRSLQQRLESLLEHIGEPVVTPLPESTAGAGTGAFRAASQSALAPLSALGYYRVGENGRLYVITKSEHYHVSLGHGFPGFGLLDHARALGIPNATHNNTRGLITRRLEADLIRLANGMAPGEAVDALASDRLSRVINIETGSLAAETALKLVLARFYESDADTRTADHAGRIPVIVVIGNDKGGRQANYHGTTLLTQAMRGMWPDLYRRLESGILRVAPVRPNCIADLERVFLDHDRAPCKIAAFFHEVVMMNYGALTLTPEFLDRAYQLCREHDVPAVADEIQSCLWYPEGFLYRRYGLRPSIVVVGKGFTGGEYAASRVLLTEPYDRLTQFGALVTNGQEELASLAYLVAMAWVTENRAVIAAMGRRIEAAIQGLAGEFPAILAGAAGVGHLMGLRFHDLASGKRFADCMVRQGYDLSVQAYKAVCPPVALTKLPLIADDALVERMIEAMRAALRQIGC